MVILALLAACTKGSDATVRTPPHHHGGTGTRAGTTSPGDTTDPGTTDPGTTDPGTTDPGTTDTTPALPDTAYDTGNGANPQGVDVSHWDGDIDWNTVRDGGIGFEYAKATQGTGFHDPKFAENDAGAKAAGVLHGAYHFAEPDSSDGTTQADFFVDSGGGWVDDGETLPGALDIEWNPNGADCYGLSKTEMTAWIHEFVDEYQVRTGRAPTIYCGKTWWSECVGSSDFGSSDALWVASWNDGSPNLPTGWDVEMFWQYGGGPVDGIPDMSDVDENVFHGSRAELVGYAEGMR